MSGNRVAGACLSGGLVTDFESGRLTGFLEALAEVAILAGKPGVDVDTLTVVAQAIAERGKSK